MQFREMVVDGVAYQRLYLAEAGTTSEIGKPELPTFGRFVAVPSGARIEVEILEERESAAVVGQQGMYRVFPAQQPQADQGAEPPFELNASWYEQDVFYPAEPVMVDEVTTLRGVNATVVRFFPVQFNAARGEMRVYSRLWVRISFSESSGQFVDQRLWSPYFENMYQQLLLNYPLLEAEAESVARMAAPPPGIASEGGAEYLIITPPGLAEQANTLADWKRLRGIDTQVRTTLQTGSTADAIRNYILDAYNEWDPAPSFVLLFGDAEFIPTHYVSVHPWSCSGCWYPSGTTTGTDLYYADMTGNYYPELAIGRIPVDTAAQATTVVKKIIDYERAPPTNVSFYSNATVAAYFQDGNRDHYDERRYIKTSEEMRDFLIGRGYSVDRVYYARPDTVPMHYNYGPYGYGEPLPADLLRPGFAWDGWTGDVQNAVNAGRFLVTHRDHGSSTNNGHSYVEGWWYPEFTAYDVRGLANGFRWPVVFSVNCETGWFDGETDFNYGQNTQSLSEALLLQPGGGAVGVMGATRITFSGYNDFVIRGFVDAIWPEFIPGWGSEMPEYRMGSVLNTGKLSMATFWGDPAGHELVQFEGFHYFGDPTMEIWTALPGSLAVSYPATMDVGATTLTVNVEQDAALVSLVKDNRIIARATSSGGNATLSFDPVDVGIINVTVTKHNYVPYEGTLEVVEPSATPAPEAPLGLEGYWTLDEESGQRLDSSGRDNHLTAFNAVGSVAGRAGLAADFESDNWEWLSITDGAQSGLDIMGSLTLVGWMKAEQAEGWQVLAGKYEYGVNNRAYRLDLRPDNTIGFIVSPDGSFGSEYLLEALPSYTLSPGTWYHVAGVFDVESQNLSVYIDGELIATRQVTYDQVYDSTAPFTLGADSQNGQVTHLFDGQLDEWRVYSRALSENEIRDLMAHPTQMPTVGYQGFLPVILGNLP
jgi:hypothetical protein